MNSITIAVSVVGIGFGFVRWIRVAQREHYIPSKVWPFWMRWWFGTSMTNAVLGAISVGSAVGAAIGSIASPVAGLVGAVVVCVVAIWGPIGLDIRGRTSKLKWTDRAKRLAVGSALIALVSWSAVASIFGAVSNHAMPRSFAALGALFQVCVVVFLELGLLCTTKLEQTLSGSFVKSASEKLEKINPTRVAITGSYGKTSTKNYVAHLVSAHRSVLASPRSFNNRNGLARTVNEYLQPGTDVFIAEMGTYGKGEIADLCTWVKPTIGVIVTIGPVHIDRMKSEEDITKYKSEILDATTRVAVLNVSNTWIRTLADEITQGSQKTNLTKVWRVGVADDAGLHFDVAVVPNEDGGSNVIIEGERFEVESLSAPAENVACAIAVARELGVASAEIVSRLSSLPEVEHRQSVLTGSTGATVIDDTFNANPVSVQRAVSKLLSLVTNARESRPDAKAYVVTPGMIELGNRSAFENESFAKHAGEVADTMIIVGQTNRLALEVGANQTNTHVMTMSNRDTAVAWIRGHAKPGDVVLYENDLPDHYA